jgi:purine-binding chemotaxis protein CheW
MERATAAAPLPDGSVLLARAGAVACALPVRDVVETMRPLPVTALAGVPACVRGVARIRGGPVPVVSLPWLLGDGETSRAARFVTVRAEGRLVALEVQAVAGVRRLPADIAAALPPLLIHAAQDAVAAVGALDGALLLVLRAGRLVPADAWAALLAAEARP